MSIISLAEMPKFQIVRSFAGLASNIVAAEAALALDIVGYPIADYAFDPRGAEEALLYWDATTKVVGDNFDMRVYVLDGGLAAPLWIQMHLIAGLPAQELERITLLRSSLCLVRITAATVNVATAGVSIRAARF